jgi:hypothetical protein
MSSSVTTAMPMLGSTRSSKSMSHMNWNVLCVRAKCARFIKRLLPYSKAMDFTQPTTEAEKALAHGLWAVYNINLPDTPRRVAVTISHILREKGYEIHER